MSLIIDRIMVLPTLRILKSFVLVSLGLLIYSNTFDSSFHFDDIYFIVRNPDIKHLSNIQAIWNALSLPSRFVTFFSFAVNYHFHHLNVFGYHVVNFLIHIINAHLVWWFVTLTFETPKFRDEIILEHKELMAYSMAVLFLVHPVQTQAVTYITQRFASLATLFYLLTCCLYIKGRLSANKAFYGGALMAATLGMFSKEITITLPVMIFLFDFFFLAGQKKMKYVWIAVAVVALIIPAIYSFNFKNILAIEHSSGSHPGDFINSRSYFLTQFSVITTYIRLLFLPVQQNLLYDYPISSSLFEITTFFSFLLLLSLLLLAVFLFKRHRLISFGIFWFFVTLCVESTVIPIRHVIFEHRVYLPSFGFLLVISSGIYYLIDDKKSLAIALIGVIGLLSLMTFQRNKVWKDGISLWSDVAKKSPYMLRPHLNLGVAYMESGEAEKAIEQYNKALDIDSEYAEAYNNRGVAYLRMEKYEEALDDFNQAIRLNPTYLNAFHSRGALFNKLRMFDLALADYNKAIELNPGHPESFNDRGSIYYHRQEYEKAISDFTKAIFYDQGYAAAYNNRASVYNLLEKYDLALVDFNKAIDIRKDFAEAYYNRSFTYYSIGKNEKALADAYKAQKLGMSIDLRYMQQLQDGVKNRERVVF